MVLESWESFPETSLKELEETLPKKVQAALNNSGKKKKKKLINWLQPGDFRHSIEKNHMKGCPRVKDSLWRAAEKPESAGTKKTITNALHTAYHHMSLKISTNFKLKISHSHHDIL